MICPKCGRQIPDGTVCPCSYGPVLSSNPAVNTLKTLGSSTLFMVLAILLSLVPVIAIFSQMAVKDSMGDIMYYAMQLDLDPSVLYPMMNAFNSSLTASAVMGAVPSILIAVGVWITYASCRNMQSGNVSTAGLTICKVLAIISLVGVCIAAAVVLLLLVILLFAGISESGYDGMGEAVSAIAVVCFVIFAAIFALMIIYEVCVIRTINRIKATATTGVPDNRVPNFLIVMNYIMAVGSGLGGLGNMVMSPVLGLSGLLSAATLVMVSILLSKYRSGMTLLMYPPVQPVYPQQPWN